MKSLSRNKRRKLIRLAYGVLAKDFPACNIERDRLHRRYPDTNYGLEVRFDTQEKAEEASKVLVEAFLQRGYLLYARPPFESRHGGFLLSVSGFYANDPDVQE